MNMKDAMEDLLTSDGWAILRQSLSEDRNRCMEQLKTVDPNNISRIIQLQQAILCVEETLVRPKELKEGEVTLENGTQD